MKTLTPLLYLLMAVLLGEISAFAAEEPAAEGAAQAKPIRRKYRKSRLTYDESEESADHRTLQLGIGEDRTVDFEFVIANQNGFIIAKPDIVAITTVKIGGEIRQVTFRGLKDGETTVNFRDPDGTLKLVFQVVVSKASVAKKAAEIRGLIRDIDGIDVRVVGQRVVIDGEVLVPQDYNRLLGVIQDAAYKEWVMNLTVLSPMALQFIAKKIQEDILVFAPNVKTRVVNGVIFLEGSVDDSNLAKKALDVAVLYLPEVKLSPVARVEGIGGKPLERELIKSFIVINAPPPKKQEKLVRVTVHFVELSKDYVKNFGFKWQPGFTADPQVSVGTNPNGGAGASGVSVTGTISSLIPKLMSAQNAGYARVLKTGTLITRSGKKASLKEATSVPFVVSGANGAAQTQSASVGIELNMTPNILGQSEDIEMDLSLAQNSIAGKAGGQPISTVHNVDTKIYVKNNESAAVAGVTSSDIGTDFNKDDPAPGSFGGQTSPLFTLLHSKAYRKKKTQFVIFVTPQIIDSASEGTEDLKKNFRVKAR